MHIDLKETLTIFIDDLKNEQFSKAHEDMEKYWKSIKKSDNPLKNLCKGYINGATAFELLKRGNKEGAKRVWSTYEKYIYILKEGIEEYELFSRANDILLELSKSRLL